MFWGKVQFRYRVPQKVPFVYLPFNPKPSPKNPIFIHILSKFGQNTGSLKVVKPRKVPLCPLAPFEYQKTGSQK